MLSGNGVKTQQRSYDELHDPRRLTMLSGNGAQGSAPEGLSNTKQSVHNNHSSTINNSISTSMAVQTLQRLTQMHSGLLAYPHLCGILVFLLTTKHSWLMVLSLASFRVEVSPCMAWGWSKIASFTCHSPQSPLPSATIPLMRETWGFIYISASVLLDL